jgi:hypothetical protein
LAGLITVFHLNKYLPNPNFPSPSPPLQPPTSPFPDPIGPLPALHLAAPPFSSPRTRHGSVMYCCGKGDAPQVGAHGAEMLPIPPLPSILLLAQLLPTSPKPPPRRDLPSSLSRPHTPLEISLSVSLPEISLPLPPSLSPGRHPHKLGVICAERHPSGRRRPPPPPDGLLAGYRLTAARWANLSYEPPWAHYLGGYLDRLLGGPLGLPDLSCTTPDGVEHKDYGEGVLG